ncbi:MAG: type II toxin-antitoxin system HicA family toxin [Tannerella sp.]|jgi:hypothetical protein|nr:type II toxin-antitoxin system HicA family toxin [Tannerella sp.]
MSTINKLQIRLLSFPKDFTYNELKALLEWYGYEEIQGAGSRICFRKKGHKIKLHRPHPGNVLKKYQLDLIVDMLINRGLIQKQK